MKTKLIPITLCSLTILWLLFIFTLSSQNGSQTAQTSEGIAKTVAEVIYQQPSETQVNEVHFIIRKLAHVGLFFALGVLSFSASATIFGWKNKSRKCLSVVVPLTIMTAYGFFDEWQKQFIDGRHFQLDEAMLNIISGIIGIAISATILYLFLIIKRKKL